MNNIIGKIDSLKSFKLSNLHSINGGTENSNNSSDDSLQVNDNFIIGPYFVTPD
ncbi:hypothetical protein [uncultured Dokdonia sp.]|uniref:hypothetical protein n=1 Tax=uncultured Dokdonia sp. TaxID=575653 RepID=UPI00261BAEB6|nr:hypothetical protein [uncultured Dokdonia sp.]